jgi:hypothetical protein
LMQARCSFKSAIFWAGEIANGPTHTCT